MSELEIVTDATVPASASLDLLVEEDTDGDGGFENSATVSVSAGTNTQTVSGFDGDAGNDVRVTPQFSTSDVTIAAKLNFADVSIPDTGTIELTTDATVPTSTSVDMLVEEDTDGDGIFTNSNTVSISDGTNTQSVSGFEAASGNDFRVTPQLSTSDVTVGVSVNSVSITKPIEAPTNVSTSVSGDDVTISWDAADGASQYDVLRAQSSGSTASDYSTIATVTDDGSASFSVTDTGLEDGEKFFYRVESVS